MSKEKPKTDWPPLLFVFIGLPFVFTYGGLWIGVAALVIGMAILGWSKRHQGSLPTGKTKSRK